MLSIKVKFSVLVHLIDKARQTIDICEHDINGFTEDMENYMDSVDNLSYNECVFDDEIIYVDLIMYDELMRISGMNLV